MFFLPAEFAKEVHVHVGNVTLRLRLNGRGFQSKLFHDLETALKTTRFRRVYTEPIQPLNPTVYVRAISFSDVRNIFKEPPLTSYRKGKSQKDTLVRAKL